MLNASEVREDDENFKNAVDLMFEQLQQRDPEHFAVRQYVKYKMAAGKTAKSILISCGARMAPFDIKDQKAGDMGFQCAAVLQSLVAQDVEHLRIDHG